MNTPTPSQDRRLTRSREDRLLGGVAGGVAAFLGIDSTLVRIGFVLLAVFGGSGIVIYLAMWLLVPPADDNQRPVNASLRAGVGEIRDAAENLANNVRTGWKRDSAGEAEGPSDPDKPPAADESDAADG
jgi:phage shock protein C